MKTMVKAVVGEEGWINEREIGWSSENRMPFIKMDFPRFNDGDDPIEWVYKAEQHFDYFLVPLEKKVNGFLPSRSGGPAVIPVGGMCVFLLQLGRFYEGILQRIWLLWV